MELFQRVKDGGIAQRSRLNWRNSVNIDPEILKENVGSCDAHEFAQVMTFLLFQNLEAGGCRSRLTVTNQSKGQEE